MTTQLPPCGLYRTTGPIAGIPAETLVYFHNHGDPGPGLYLPERWQHNRATFAQRGNTLPGPEGIAHLEPLPPEGYYRVVEGFHCCERQCRQFEPEMLVQLGYNASGQAILFLPELLDGMLAVPQRGTLIDHENFARIRILKLQTNRRPDQLS